MPPKPSCSSLTDAVASYVEELLLQQPDLRVFVHWNVDWDLFGTVVAQYQERVFVFVPGALGRGLNYCSGTSFLVEPYWAQVGGGESYTTAVFHEVARWVHAIRNYPPDPNPIGKGQPVFLHVYARECGEDRSFYVWVITVEGIRGREPRLVEADYYIRQGHEVMDSMQCRPNEAREMMVR